MSGWIKLQRDIMDHWIAQDAEYLLVWVRMLSEANYETQTKMFNGQVITVGRGQLIFGLDSYAAKTKVSVMRLRRLLDTMEKHQMINRVKNAKYSLISIVNYDKYQADNRQTTGTEQAQNKQTTVTQQADNNTIRSKELQEGKELKKIDSQQADELSAIFDHWCVVMGKSGKAKFTEDRKRAVKARMKEGYTAAHIMQAIDGCARSDFHMARDGKNTTVYDDLAMICKSGSQLEKLAMNIGAGSMTSGILNGYQEFVSNE